MTRVICNDQLFRITDLPRRWYRLTLFKNFLNLISDDKKENFAFIYGFGMTCY